MGQNTARIQNVTWQQNSEQKDLFATLIQKPTEIQKKTTIKTESTDQNKSSSNKNRQNIEETSEEKLNEPSGKGQSAAIFSKSEVIFKNTIVLNPFSQKNSFGNLEKLQKILSAQHKVKIKGSIQTFFTPESQDCTFHISNTSPKFQNQILQFEAQNFFERVLRKRTFLGINKDYEEIFIAKDYPLKKTLTILSEQEEQIALKVFQSILQIGEERRFNSFLLLLSNILALCQNTSQQLKNQVFLQFLKQSNTKHQLASIRIYQSFLAFLHIYIPDQDFIFSGLYLLYKRLTNQQNSRQQEKYLHYFCKKMMRTIEHPLPIQYMPTNYQIIALMRKRQVSILVYLSTGNSVLVNVESYHSFADIKEKALNEFGINTKRIKPDMFRFFEIVCFHNSPFDESPINESRSVWDYMTQIQLVKQQYQKTNDSPPVFFLVLKIIHAFEIFSHDIQGIEICFAQCYLDYFAGKIILELQQIAVLAACANKIHPQQQPQHQIQHTYPVWVANKYDRTDLKNAIIQNIQQIQAQKLKPLQIKYLFLTICSQCPLAIAAAVPTHHSITMFFKPNKLYIADKGQIKEEFDLSTIQKWMVDEQKLVFGLKGSKQKARIFFTEYSFAFDQFVIKQINQKQK